MPANLQVLDYLRRQDEQQETDNLELSLSNATTKNPDQQAEVQRIARDQNVPADVVDRNMPDFQKKQARQQTNLQSLRDNYPSTARFLSNQDNAAIAHDDIDNLRSMEDAIKLADSKNWYDLDLSNTFKNFSKTFPEQISKAGKSMLMAMVEANTFQPDPLRTGTFNYMPTTQEEAEAKTMLEEGRTQMVESLIADIKESEDRISKLTPDDLSTLEQGIRSGIESVSLQLPGLVASIITKNPAYSLAPMVAYTGIEAYGSGRAEGLDPSQAVAYAGVDAFVEYFTEKIPAESLVNVFKSINKSGAAKELVKFAISEVGGEQAATLLQSSNAMIHGLDEQLNEATSVQEMIDIQMQRQAVTFFASIVGAGTQTAIATGANAAMNAVTKKRGREHDNTFASFQEQVSLDNIITLAQTSRVNGRARERFGEFVEMVKEDRKAYIDTEKLIEARDSGIELPESLDKALNEASKPGLQWADTQMSLKDFAADVATQEDLITAIRPHIRQSADKQTQAELDNPDNESLKVLMARANQNQQIKTETDEIYEQVKDQIIATGRQSEATARYSAAIIPAYVSIKAQETNKSPREIFERMGLKVVGPGEPLSGGQTLEQPDLSGVGQVKIGDYETGKPMSINYVHNKESATRLFGKPDKDSPYGRGYEPSGKYVTQVDSVQEDLREGMESGTVTFNNPLVIDNDNLNWKKKLSDAYGGLTGKNLSKALIENGYDGVVTVETDESGNPRYISEVLDLTSFDESIALFQKAPPVESDAFKKWFGDSKVVDEQGNPLVVYHGTEQDFSEFSHGAIYSSEGASQSGSGFYFTTNKESSGNYAMMKGGQGGTVYPVYLSIKNPLPIDFRTGEVFGAEHDLTRSEVKKIIMSVNDIRGDDSPLQNFGDIEYEGFDKVLNEAINAYADGNNFAALRNDFFGDDHAAWLRALHDSIGYDGAVSVLDDGTKHYVAWFPEQIKSAIGNRGTFDPNDPNILNQSAQPIFYSQLLTSIEQAKQAKATPEQWLAQMKKSGVKQEEMDWLGIEEFMAGKKTVTKEELSEFVASNQVEVNEVMMGGEFTESEFRNWMNKNRATEDPYYEDVVGTDDYQEYKDAFLEEMKSEGMNDTKFASQTLPGGENYRELLLTLPETDKVVYTEENVTPLTDREVAIMGSGSTLWYFRTPDNVFQISKTKYPEQRAAKEYIIREKQPESPASTNFKSGHYEEPNVLAHVRLNERTDADGKRVLFIEEIQSDWHQAGRKKGYKKSRPDYENKIKPLTDKDKKFYGEEVGVQVLTSQGQWGWMPTEKDAKEYLDGLLEIENRGLPPDAPFKKTWPLLTMKRMIRYAAENGYDRIAWTTGEQQAERYDLSKQVEAIRINQSGDIAVQQIDAPTRNGRKPWDTLKTGVPESEYAEYIGKEAAEKISKMSPDVEGNRVLSGLELKVGGEGMKGFYDNMLPKMVGKYVKKWGVKVGTTSINFKEKPTHKVLSSIERQQIEDIDREIDNLGERDSEDANNTRRVLREQRANVYKEAAARGQKTHAIDITDSMRESVMQGQQLFQTEERGSIALLDEARIIRLGQSSDLSTFLHESAHLFLEMEKSFAYEYGASEDQMKILSWLGLKSFDELDPTTDKGREAHEKFARGFEAYLREGKAPSLSLRDAFAAFARWLKRIYQNLRMLDVELTYEIREVFDRMLATEEEIAIATANPAYDQFFRSQEQAGMTDDEWQKYTKRAMRVMDNAEQTVNEKLLKELRKRRSREWRDEKLPLIEEEKKRLEQQRVYQAMQDLEKHPLDYNQVLSVLGVTRLPGRLIGKAISQKKPKPVKIGPKQKEQVQKEALTARQRYKRDRIVRPEEDELLVAIAKLGGMSREDAEAQGIDPADFKRYGWRILRVFTNNGAELDGLAENLSQYGYPVFDEAGNYDANVLLDAIDESLRARPVYAMAAMDNIVAEQIADADEATALQEMDEEAGFDIERVSPDAPMLEDGEYQFLENIEDIHLADVVYHVRNIGLPEDDIESILERGAIQELSDAEIKENLKQATDEYVGRQGAVPVQAQPGEQPQTGETAEGAVDVTEYAEVYGYPSAEAFLNDIINSPTLNQAAEAAAQARMIQKYGDILNDGTIEAEAREAVHNEEQAKLLLQEVRAMGRKANKPEINREYLKAQARDMIGSMKHGDIQPYRYYRAEIKAAQKAVTAKNDQEKYTAKVQQLVNHYLYKEASQAKQNIEKYRKYIDGVKRRDYSVKNVKDSYIQNMKALARMYDTRKSKDGRDRLDDLLNWYITQLDDPNEYIKVELLDPNLVMAMDAKMRGALAEFKLPTYKDMTADELRGAYEMLRHLRYVGGKVADQGKAEFNAKKEKLAESIADNGGRRRKNPDEPQRGDAWISSYKTFMHKLANMRNLVLRLDGMKEDGPAYRAIYKPMDEANNRAIELKMRLAEQFKDELAAISTLGIGKGDKRTIKRELTGEDFTLSSEGRVMLALYWGTESSRQAIMEGHIITEGDVERMLSYMTPDELKLVNAVWKLNESLWPDLSSLSVKLYGVAPTKLEPTPYEVNGVRLTGGHMRLIYEGTVDELDDQVEKIVVDAPISQSKAGSLHERVGSGGRLVRLSKDNITRALTENAHAIAFGEATAEIAGYLNSRTVKDAIISRHGKEFYNALLYTADGVLTTKREKNYNQMLAMLIRQARTSATYMHLAYSIRNSAQQISALPQAAREVGHANLLREYNRFITHPKMYMEEIKKHSPAMENRARFVNREAAEQMARISEGGTWETIKQYGFFMQTTMDSLIAYPTWMAKFSQGIEEHGDVDKAVSDADRAVAFSVGTGQDIDMGGTFQSKRTESTKMFTMFGGWFHSQYQRIYRSYYRGDARIDLELMETIFLTPALSGMIAALVIMDAPEDDEELYEWTAQIWAEYVLAMFPVAREISAVFKGFTPKNPVGAQIESVVGAMNAVSDMIQGEKGYLETLSKVGKGAGAVVPIPGVGQVTRMMDYWVSYEQGKEGEFNPYQAVVKGKTR